MSFCKRVRKYYTNESVEEVYEKIFKARYSPDSG